MEKLLNIDFERMTATVPLTKEPMILMVNQGKAKIVALHEYGEFIAKTHEGKINHFSVSETGRF